MSYPRPLPAAYRPYEELEICSNLFQGVTVPIAVDDFPAFLIGRGEVPRIWLSAPISLRTSERGFVVHDNSAVNPRIRIVSDSSQALTKVLLEDALVLQARHLEPARARVESLDLRSFGLRVWGDSSGLFVGSSLLARNTYVRSDPAMQIVGLLPAGA